MKYRRQRTCLIRSVDKSVRAFGAALLAAAPLAVGATDIVHTEPSEFAPIIVYDVRGERCMKFESMQALGRQTCIDQDAPDKLVFDYTRMMLSALMVHPTPKSILIVGLGGGTLPRALFKALPDATIDTVEIDPAVVNVARRYFGYQTGPRQRVFVEDGRAFIERAHREGRHYDLIMLDAFDVNYIPPHLLTREFLQHVKAVLTPNGVVVANTFSRSKVYDQESATYADVFGDFFNLRNNNRVIIATRGPLPTQATLHANARALSKRLELFGVNATRELRMFSRERDWDPLAPVLTD